MRSAWRAASFLTVLSNYVEKGDVRIKKSPDVQRAKSKEQDNINMYDTYDTSSRRVHTVSIFTKQVISTIHINIHIATSLNDEQ